MDETGKELHRKVRGNRWALEVKRTEDSKIIIHFTDLTFWENKMERGK